MISAYLHSVAEVLAELHEQGIFPDCSALVTDHRQLSGTRDVLLAVPGRTFDPRNLADDLLHEQRCGLVLAEYDERRVYQSAGVIPVLNLRSMLAELAEQYYGTRQSEVQVFAVTGTNGKTTVTRWLAQALNQLGCKAAVIGTLGYGLPDELKSHSGLTTPDVVGMHHLIHSLASQSVKVVCVEASSIGLEQGRLNGVPIQTAVFTNLSQDHLDYHHTMEAYGQAKLLLAKWPTLTAGVVNADDPFAVAFQDELARRELNCITVGRGSANHITIEQIEHTASGLRVRFSHGGLEVAVSAPVIGDFNAENLALVYGALLNMGHQPVDLVRALSTITSAPGRMEWVADSPCVIVDYAHTPDALERVLKTMRPLALSRGGRLCVVFGCGGDRDKTKRPLMGKIAAQWADVVVLTSDNPRSEKPESILEDILHGIAQGTPLHVEVDRARAIEWAVQEALPNDVILLAGKGHEQTQTIGREIKPHSDVELARALVGKRGLHA